MVMTVSTKYNMKKHCKPEESTRDQLARIFFLFTLLFLSFVKNTQAQQHQQHTTDKSNYPKESDYYQIVDVPMPKQVLPEVGGLAMLPDGQLAMANRRGEVWLINNPSSSKPSFDLFASGLHEPLGLTYKDNALYLAQRSELTRISDTDQDQKADRFERLVGWPLSGNYCEYNHGPVLAKDGNFYINMNLGDNGMGAGAEAFYGEMGSHADWRGWMMKITPEGVMTPYAAGLRSPAGIGLNEKGEVFYTENQGGWIGTGYISHVEEGDFFGHPSSLKSAKLPGSTVKITEQDIPTDAPLFHQAVKQIPGLTMPSVRLPHGIMGVSNASFIVDHEGVLGPFFKDQFFIGDQGHAKIVRVSMEKVNGKYQGAVYPFRSGFASGILRMEVGHDRSVFVGMTDRGWHSTGKKREGLQRLVWNKNIPFEIQRINAKSDGFEIHFTKPVALATLTDALSYQIASFDYRYHQKYGSDVMDQKTCEIIAMLPAKDQKSVRLVVKGLREGYIHEMKMEGLLAQEDAIPLLHDFAYYSLNSLPIGDNVSLDAPGVVLAKAPMIDEHKPLTEEITPKLVSTNKQKKSDRDNTSEKRNVAPLTKRLNTMPAGWGKVEQTIVIGTKPGMRYDIETIDLKPNTKVKLTFKNVDDMQHNLLIVRPSASNEVGELALKMGLNGPKLHYVPMSDKVLYHTGLLQPRSEETIYFIAPEQEGKYEFVCTYPGHYMVMKGIINIKK